MKPIEFVCFKCEQTFTEPVEHCLTCSWRKCPHCGACLCTLTPEERRVAKAMYATYGPARYGMYPHRFHPPPEAMERAIDRLTAAVIIQTAYEVAPKAGVPVGEVAGKVIVEEVADVCRQLESTLHSPHPHRRSMTGEAFLQRCPCCGHEFVEKPKKEGKKPG